MIKKREIQEPSDYLLEIIGAYKDRGHDLVSLDQIKMVAMILSDKGLPIYDFKDDDHTLEKDLNMLNRDENYLRCYFFNYELTDSGKEFLKESIIPIAGNQRRIFYDTIDTIIS